MNQEQNNSSQNTLNTQDNNGILNNQSFQNNQSLNNAFNNQQQVPTNYQQSIHQTNIQEHISQPMNSLKNGNSNNQNLNNPHPKKKNLWFISVTVCLAVGVIVIATTFLTNSSKNKNNSSNDNEISESTNNNNNNNNNNIKDETASIKLPHEIFDVNKFDPTLFSGIVYDSNQTQYNIRDLFQKNHTICISGCYPLYYLTQDKDVENDSWNQSINSDDKVIEFIMKTLGNPSTIYENYHYSEEDSGTNPGSISILYNYNDYIIDIGFYDYRHWKGYNYISLKVSHVMIYTKDRFNSVWAPFFKDYKCYGEKLF